MNAQKDLQILRSIVLLLSSSHQTDNFVSSRLSIIDVV